MSTATMEIVIQATRQAEAAPHGEKQKILQEAAKWLGVSLQHFYRLQDNILPANKQRKRRSDAGQFALTRDEAKAICAYMMAPTRNNGKRLPSLEMAVDELRANGVVSAAQLNEDTGELVPLSASAIARAMRAYRLHPEILERPAPAIHLRSLHPNHLWQIDPSLCVLYYLPTQKGESLQVMSEKEFYKNKPNNIRRIEKERVWRYVVTDHASGVIYVQYVLGAESGRNLVDAFIGATQKSDHAADPFCGIPKMVMVDPGSANTGAVFRNLCRALGITLQVNTPGQPRASGQVEKANDIVERHFEHRLIFLENPPTSLEELNTLAWRWMRHFNAKARHSRHGRARYDAWLSISEEQLVFAPSVEAMRAAATHKPEERTVNGFLEVSYKGNHYSVKDIPEVMVGEKVLVTRDAYEEDAARVFYLDEEGNETTKKLLPLQKNDLGFFDDAVVVGETYHAHADTSADTHRKELERYTMGASTDEEAAAKRKAKHTPFGGAIDPMASMDDATLPTFIKKRGSEHQLTLPVVEPATLTLFEASRALSIMVEGWNSTHYDWLSQRYPEGGVSEADLPSIAAQLNGGATVLRGISSGGNA